jgi:hypothetical protein
VFVFKLPAMTLISPDMGVKEFRGGENGAEWRATNDAGGC